MPNDRQKMSVKHCLNSFTLFLQTIQIPFDGQSTKTTILANLREQNSNEPFD